MQATVATPQQVAALMNVLTMHINRTTAPEMFRLLGDFGLSFTQMKTLYMLLEHGELPVGDLAGRLSMSVAAMSRSVEGLVGRGYVARRESASDRRCRLIALLPEGNAVLERLMTARQAAMTAFAEELTDAERTALHTALLPIAERITSP